MSGSSSNMRRNPRRTRLWSSTSNTVIFFAIGLHPFSRNRQMQECSAFGRMREHELSTHQFRAFAHRHQTNPLAGGALSESYSMIFYFEFKRGGKETQPYPRPLDPRMPCHIVQRFLQHAVNVHTGGAIHWKGRSLFFIGYGNSGLPLNGGDIPVKSVLQAGLIEHHGMQGLGKAADFIQRRLSYLAYFLNVGAQR